MGNMSFALFCFNVEVKGKEQSVSEILLTTEDWCCTNREQCIPEHVN